jgi:hypothetical protein
MTNSNFDREDDQLEFDRDDEELAIVHISRATDDMVEREFAAESDEIKDALKQLIEAVKHRAQTEAQSAGDVTKEAYLAALAKTRKLMADKQIDLPLDRAQIDKSIGLIEVEARKNWQSVVKEARQIGKKLSRMARSAWENWQDR